MSFQYRIINCFCSKFVVVYSPVQVTHAIVLPKVCLQRGGIKKKEERKKKDRKSEEIVFFKNSTYTKSKYSCSY